MKKILIILFLALICSFLVINHHINNIYPKEKIVFKYSKNNEYAFVSKTKKSIISNEQDLLNIFYTSLNDGLASFTFTCIDNYDCLNDVINTLNDKNKMYVINNLVSPYNSYQDFNISLKNNEYIITFNKIYNPSEIDYLERKIDIILNNLINDNLTNEEKLVIIHNYIINNISYDKDNEIGSNKATFALLKRKAICTGYADLLAIILDKLDIPNYRVVSSSHVWNAVYINNKWLHIDLTYDDPIDNNKLSYNYFLVDSSYLKDNNHKYNKDIYTELI